MDVFVVYDVYFFLIISLFSYKNKHFDYAFHSFNGLISKARLYLARLSAKEGKVF